MSVITFFDLVKDTEYRNFVSNRLAQTTETPYSFPSVLPKLYQYKPLSLYAINDICFRNVTASSIGEFNDLFDGALHRYGNEEERICAAEKKWEELETLRRATNIPELYIKHDYYVDLYRDHYKTDSWLKFRMLEYLGTYVSCFSSKNDSVLMWSHYARSNTGICVEYDFAKLPEENLISKMIFPIAYTDSPVKVFDLLDDEQQKLYKYSLDAAVLCAALNKSNVWAYEKEWRLVCVFPFRNDPLRRVPFKTTIKPSRIYFGYHFLRPMFYYDTKNEYQNAKNNLEQLMRLIDFMEANSIGMSIMLPQVGNYDLIPQKMDVESIKRFMYHHFDDGEPENMRFYHTIHDYLMNLIEKEEES